MIINYNFDGNDFDYEIDVDNYLKLYCSAQDLIDIAKDYWDDMPAEDKEQYIKEGITSVNDSTPIDVISDILSDIDDDWFKENVYSDIKDAFEDDAREAYDDYEDYKSDPLGYYGMRSSDFI